MIIKKKYTSIKRAIDETPHKETLSVIDDVVQAYENTQEPIEQNEEEEQLITNSIPADLEGINENTQEQIEQNEEEIQDLDLSLQNIRFEQREERREGTRRRGYRRSQDRNIITRAQQEAITIKESAKQEGYNAGIKNAEQDLETIKSQLKKFFDCREEVYEKVSNCILDIAVQISKRILNKEVEENREYIIPIIKGQIEDISKTENKITLKVKPKDVEIVKDKITEIFTSEYFEAKITVVPDNGIKEGGVIIETSNGIVDATIDTQIAIIEQALKKGEADT